MNRQIFGVFIVISVGVVSCSENSSPAAVDRMLTPEELSQARALPSYAVASMELESMGTYLGGVRIAVEPDDTARLVFSGTSADGKALSGTIALPDDELGRSRGGLRLRHTQSDGAPWLLHVGGNLIASSGQHPEVASWLVRNVEVRMEATGLFAIEAQVVAYTDVDFRHPEIVREPRRFHAVGRMLGECRVLQPDGTVLEDPRFTARPRCRELLSRL